MADVVRRIGGPALPELEDLVEDGDCNIYVNEWAQEMVFDIMGLDAAGRRRVCHHGTVVRSPGEVWRCPRCGAELDDDGRQAGNVTPVSNSTGRRDQE